jgi:hypothetical protein
VAGVGVAGTVLVTVTVVDVEAPPPQPTMVAKTVVSAATSDAPLFR